VRVNLYYATKIFYEFFNRQLNTRYSGFSRRSRGIIH